MTTDIMQLWAEIAALVCCASSIVCGLVSTDTRRPIKVILPCSVLAIPLMLASFSLLLFSIAGAVR